MCTQRVRHNSQANPIGRRRGAATVELAICLPIIMLLVFGSIEAANAIHLKQTATIAAYEGAQAITSSGGTQADALLRANSILTQRNVSGGVVTISPTVTSATPKGTPITVTVTIPVDDNSLSMTSFFSGWEVVAAVNMEKL
jgi:Flp pilus assembly protein TadG